MDENFKVCVSLNLDRGLRRYTSLYKGIQDYVENNTNWSLYWDHFPELRLRKSFPGAPYYNAVIGRIKQSAYQEIKRLKIPCTNVWYNNNLTEKIPSTLFDYKAMGRQAANHFINRGFKNLVHIDFNDISSLHYSEGVKEVLNEYGYRLSSCILDREYSKNSQSWEKQIDTFRQWSEEWEFPMAVCSSSAIIVAVTCCNQLGIRIPEDLAIVITSDEQSYTENMRPKLTTVNLDYEKLGYKAVESLHKKITKEKEDVFIDYYDYFDLVSRESTDSYLVDDELVKKCYRLMIDDIGNIHQVADLVRRLEVSRTTLETRFSKETGHSLKEEMDRIKVEKATDLIHSKNYTLKEITFLAGFSSAQHMRRTFVRIKGQTPASLLKK